MRLYNAQSCTPAATAKVKLNPSFPPRGFLPSPKKKRTYKVQRYDMEKTKTTSLEKYRQSGESRNDKGTGREENNDPIEGREEAISSQEPRKVSTVSNAVKSNAIKATKANAPQTKTFHNQVTQPLQENAHKDEGPMGTCFLSFPKKKKRNGNSKRNSAFHSPLRIAKYSFQSPAPVSTSHTLSTDSTLDLVFSPGDESQDISKNETGTTAETNESCPAKSDTSESFVFDIEVVKSETDTPAQMLETGSVISKSSSSTLTSNFAGFRNKECKAAENPFDELEVDRKDSRSMFSPIPWQHKARNDAAPQVEKRNISGKEPRPAQEPEESSVFGAAWLEDKLDGFSEGGSWIDFTADPFKTHTSNILERPSPTKPDDTFDLESVESDSQSPSYGFIVKKNPETRTMENYSSRQSNSGASEISFPSLSGANTWSQVETLDDKDDKVLGKYKPLNQDFQQTKPPQLVQPRLLGSVLQARFEANRKAHRMQTGKANSRKQLPGRDRCRTQLVSRPPLPRAKTTAETATHMRNDWIPAMQDGPGAQTSKYAKMLDIGIPAGAVKNATSRSGVDVSLLFQNELPSSKHDGGSAPSKERDGLHHFKLHWEARTDVGKNTLWSKLKRDAEWIQKTILIDENQFSNLFQDRRSPFSPLRPKTPASMVRVIEAKRANNGDIVLSQIKMSYEHTAQAIDRMDITSLSIDQMKAILPYIPTPEEASKLRQSLRTAIAPDWFKCECEKFMIAMLRVPEAPEKLNHMIFIHGFHDVVAELEKDAVLMQRACQEVMSSQNFRRVVALLLTLGNRVNNEAKVTSSAAAAFSLESLVLLNQNKAFDRKTTFLEYAASLFRKYAPEALDWRQEDMPSLRRAHKVKWNLWLAEVELIQGKLNSLRARGLHSTNLARPGDTSARMSSPIWNFVCQADVELSALKEVGTLASSSLEKLWEYFGEACSTPSRCDSILGTLVLFGHQWEQAVEQIVRREREDRRKAKPFKETSQPDTLSPASSKASQHSPFLTSSQSYGQDV